MSTRAAWTLGAAAGELECLLARVQADAERIERLKGAIRDVWPHLTGHCFEGSTPECFAKMRDLVSGVMPDLTDGPFPEVE